MWNSGSLSAVSWALAHERTGLGAADVRAPAVARCDARPIHAVKEEVEHSVTVVIDLHKRWHELSASSKKGDEWEWTACASAAKNKRSPLPCSNPHSSLLCARSRAALRPARRMGPAGSRGYGEHRRGQPPKVPARGSGAERKNFIESTRRQIVALRDEVQARGDDTRLQHEELRLEGHSVDRQQQVERLRQGWHGNDDEMTPASDIEMSGGRSMAGGATMRGVE